MQAARQLHADTLARERRAARALIGASIVAQEHKLDPPLVTLMIGIGIPLSFLTLPLWWYALQGV